MYKSEASGESTSEVWCLSWMSCLPSFLSTEGLQCSMPGLPLPSSLGLPFWVETGWLWCNLGTDLKWPLWCLGQAGGWWQQARTAVETDGPC